MKAVLKLNKWANAHTHIGFDALRLLLGGFLIFKGLFFFDSGLEETYHVLKSLPGLGGNLILIHYIAMAHIAGGALIMMGLLTRIAVLVQLPILIGAVIVNAVDVVRLDNLIEASFTLAACVFFLFYGSGRNSVDKSLKMYM